MMPQMSFTSVYLSLAFSGPDLRPLRFRRLSAGESITIVEPQKAELPEQLAAREIRRYLYLRTGQLVPIVPADSERPSGRSIVIGHKDQPIVDATIKGAAKLAESVKSLQPQQYLLKTIPLASGDGKPVLLVVGGDPVGTLYGAYRLAEHWASVSTSTATWCPMGRCL